MIKCIDNFPHFPEELKDKVTSVSFTRHGGVSKGKFKGLNLCFKTGDLSENVFENRKRVSEYLHTDKLIAGEQVHGNTIFLFEETSKSITFKKDIPSTDALITTLPNVALMIKQADCQAVTLFDPCQGVVSNIHCGWRGNVNGILKKALNLLYENYGTEAGNLWVSISPALGVCCAEFNGWKELLPEPMHKFVRADNHCDFKAISVNQLMELGVPEEQIHCSDLCSYCSMDFFSYRRNKVTGRYGTVIMKH